LDERQIPSIDVYEIPPYKWMIEKTFKADKNRSYE
jgi:hypothetical protein